MESVGRLNDFIRTLNSKTPVVVDASGVQFMDSSGLHVLVKLAAAANGHVGVVIRNPSQPVRRLLRMALPDGIDGMEIEFDGAGPGAAHRFSQLVGITAELHRVARRSRRRSALLRAMARQERARHAVIDV
jgi:hypothetical protein